MPEPLILKVQADTQGVPQGFGQVQRSVDNLDFSSRKASVAMRGFVQDLAEARNASDVASAALGAFSKILGTSIAATGLVIAGKAIIDSFSNVSKIVEDTKDRIAKVSAEIAASGLDVGFTQAANEAKRLSDEANSARAAIEKLDKSFLTGLIATITGAREELGKLAADADSLAQKRLGEGARTELARAEARAGLSSEQIKIEDIKERVRSELQPVKDVFEEGAKIAADIIKRGEIEIQAIRQKAFDEFDKKQAALELRGIDADAKGAEAAGKIALDFDNKMAEQAERIEKMREENQKKKEQAQKEEERLIDKAAALGEKQIAAQDRVNAAREALIIADAKVAGISLGIAGSGRGVGQRPSSAEVGAEARAEQERFKATRKAADQEYQRWKKAQEEGGKPSDKYAYSRYLEEQRKEEARRQGEAPFTEQEEARKNLSKSEDYLKSINDLLEDTLDKLTAYAHAK